MCMTCGCGKGQTLIGGHALARQRKPGKEMRYRAHDEGTVHAQPHDHPHTQPSAHDTIDFGAGPAGTHAPGMSQSRMVKIERDILAKNNDYADPRTAAIFPRTASLRSIWSPAPVPAKPRCW